MTRTAETKKMNTPLPGMRCAIYTRKSTEEGLEQEFNSLDAQRDAGEAYITSQKHEGWVCLSDRYDDGGFTGGNMDRPALQRLLADIEAGKVDCIVVYKVDRLSRSLIDFSKIMDVLERHKVSFVAVRVAHTQGSAVHGEPELSLPRTGRRCALPHWSPEFRPELSNTSGQLIRIVGIKQLHRSLACCDRVSPPVHSSQRYGKTMPCFSIVRRKAYCPAQLPHSSPFRSCTDKALTECNSQYRILWCCLHGIC